MNPIYKFFKRLSVTKKVMTISIALLMIGYIFCLPRQLFHVPYNDCPEIREIWDKPNIHIEEISRLNNLAQRYDGGCQYAELLISNYDTSERLQAVRQLSLFDDETDNLEV